MVHKDLLEESRSEVPSVFADKRCSIPFECTVFSWTASSLDHFRTGSKKRFQPHLLCHCQSHLCKHQQLIFSGSSPSALRPKWWRALLFGLFLRPSAFWLKSLRGPFLWVEQIEVLTYQAQSLKGPEWTISAGFMLYFSALKKGRMQFSAEMTPDYRSAQHCPLDPFLPCLYALGCVTSERSGQLRRRAVSPLMPKISAE